MTTEGSLVVEVAAAVPGHACDAGTRAGAGMLEAAAPASSGVEERDLFVAAATTVLMTLWVTPAFRIATSASGVTSKFVGLAWMTAKIVLSARPLFVMLIISISFRALAFC